MTTYIINAPILTKYGLWQFEGPLTITCAKLILVDGFTSAIGHSASADILSRLLNITIPVNRIHITMEPGDRALILRLMQRLPEGKVLNKTELNKTPFELGLLTRLS